MHAVSNSSGRSPLRRVAILGLVFVAAILSCGKDITGPLGAAARYVRGFSWSPIFPPAYQLAGGSASGVVAFDRVHVVLHHDDGTVALDTVIDFPAGVDSLTVSLTVKLLDNAPAAGEQMSLNLGYLDAAGDTVFKGGPISVTAAPPPAGGGPSPTVQVPVSYTGPGASAAAVAISPRSATVVAGSGFSFSAIAKDNTGAAIAGTPIVWNSADPSVATITSPAAGIGVAQNVRGTARIIAQLLTGPADTVQLFVTLPASQLLAQSGNAQTGVVGATLAQPLVVKVAASDGVGVAGTTVNFAVASGGGSVATASAVSDVNGLAQTSWKLGTGTGAQTVTATAGSLANSPLTLTATAQAATATKLVVTTPPVNGVAGIALTPIVIAAEDNTGNIATTFTGPVTVAFGASATGAVLAGTTTVNAVAGVATFSTLAINKNGTAFTLVASSANLTSATTSAFDIALGAPSKLVFTVQPSIATANVAITPAIVVNAQDSQGNPTPSFTGAVTLGFGTNPTSATLGGTATQTAVAGVATFGNITVSAAGIGYALSASATGLTSATSSLFNIGGGVATAIVVASGGGQTGTPSAALAAPIVIQVNDAGANPVAGTTVNFAVVTGGGSVLPVSGVSNASGQVQTTWTLGATLGAQSISATSTGLTGSPLTINATAAASAATQLVITTQPSSTAAGASISPAIVVTAKDALNNVATTFTGNVTLAFGANPGASILGGTLTVAAVSGVATFNAILLSKAAAGYTLVASSGGLTSATTNTFTIIAGAASTLGITAGQAQSGNAGSALATPLAVTILDANANPVSGVTVNWATPSGGSLSPVSSVTNAAGVATTTWTLGAAPGAQTATATSGTLTGSPATFNATATLTSFSKTWTGATSTAWTTATNWAPTGVPAATDSVFVPVSGNAPVLGASATVAGLSLAAGAQLTLSGGVVLTDNGNLSMPSGIIGTGSVVLAGTARTVGSGPITGAVTITGTYSLSSAVTVNGATTVSGSGGLTLAGHGLIVNGAFGTAGTGTITMTNAADALTVNGAATFAGGSETGLLGAGNLTVTGNFTQSTTATSFNATASHVTTFSGATVQTISFANPGTSGFGAATFANTTGITVSSNLQTNGNTTVVAGTSVNGGTNSAHIGGTLTDPGAGLHFASLQFAGTTTPVAATTPTLNVAGSVDFTVPSALAGNLVINGALAMSSSLTVSGYALTINGNFSTNVASVLVMTNAADSVVVNGNATFGGGSESGLLTAGKLHVTGNFAQVNGGSGAEFQATAPHVTVLSGSAAQTITFANPDTVQGGGCTLSCFGSLTINKTGGTVIYNSPAHHHGKLRILGGATSVSAVGTAGNQRFITVHDSLISQSLVPVTFTRLGIKGNVSTDTLTVIDTIGFGGSASQVIPNETFNEVIIKGTPTVGAGGFTTNADLVVDGGSLTLGGNSVSVLGGFVTTNGGTLTMNNALDSLFVVGHATFAGAAVSGNLTNGVLVLFQGITVAGPNQFNASGNHVTYLVGPQLGCDCTDILAPGRRGIMSMSVAAAAATHHGRLTAAGLAARNVAAAAKSKAARAAFAAMLAARKALAAKWTPRTNAVRAAIAAGRAARTPGAGQQLSASVAAITKIPANLRLGAPRAPGSRRSGLSASVVVQAYSDSAVTVAFGDTTANQFANVRVVGNAQWQTFARAAGNVQLDETGAILGAGHLAIGGTLFGASNSALALESVELFGILSDTGSFTPDTTVFSGTSQTMPSYVGSGEPSYNNVVVNSPSLSVLAEDGNEIDVDGSLFVLNSGQLRIGAPDSACVGCESDELYVYGALETHGAGTLRMNDSTQYQPFVSVGDSAWFAGGSSTGLLTSGEIYYYGNFRQSGPTVDAYAATSPHQSYFGASSGTEYITFANPGYPSSHFGDLYLGDPTTALQSNVFADGQLQFGHVASHTVSGTPGTNITSKGASARDILFNGVSWILLDGYPVDDMDAVEFSNQVATGTQFTIQRDSGLTVGLTNWIFDTTPTGGGLYISATDPDGATNGFLTLNMSGTSPGISGGFTSALNGAIINGWTATVVDNWLGYNSVWNSTTNWSTGLVPTASTDVTISCDCSYPVTNVAAAVHNLTISNGAQLTLGSSSPLTVNGNLSVSSNSDIDVSSASATLLGNVTLVPTASTAGIYCGTGSTGAILSGTGTQSVTGKFCRLVVNSSVMASGAIVVKNNTAGDAGLTVGSGGNLNFNSQRIETDSMYTTGTGVIAMTHAVDSLVVHGANVANPVYFNGGSTSGLITNGTIVDHSPYFKASGTAFDAANGLNTIVADSGSFQGFQWVGASVGHGINNLIAKNTSKMFSGGDLVITGTLTLDASMTTSGLFQATGHYLYVGQVVDNTGNTNGALSGGGYWVHLTGNGTVPAVIGVDSLFFDYGGNVSLTNTVSANAVIVNNNTRLILNGNVLATNGHSFTTQNGGTLQMTLAGDSLDATGGTFFNGGSTSGLLTAGGILTSNFLQGYTPAFVAVPGASSTSFAASAGHHVYLVTGSTPTIKFENPGTGAGGSHFGSLQNRSDNPTTLESDMFVDDSLASVGLFTAAFNSDVLSSAAGTRLITAQGLNIFHMTFGNVALKLVNGQTGVPSIINSVWQSFPTAYTGTAFEIAWTPTTTYSFTNLDFTSMVLSGLGVGGEYVKNSGTQALTFSGILGITLTSLAAGTATP